MSRLAYAILTGLIGAAFLHVVIILALPQFTGKDAYTRVQAEGRANRFWTLGSDPHGPRLANIDPFLKVAVCHFDISESPIRLSAEGQARFWSLALFDKDSNEIFSMNDHTSVDGTLDVLAASAGQLALIRKALPEGLTHTIFVELAKPAGYAVLRVMAPQASYEEPAAQFLKEAGCQPFRLG